MALIICPECGRQISDQAAMCVGCGISMEKIKEILGNEETTKIPENIESPTHVIVATPDSRRQSSLFAADLKDKKIKCTVCSNEYNLSEFVCPKCGYPAVNLGINIEKSERLIDKYRKGQ